MSLNDVLKTDIAFSGDLQRSATGDFDLVSGLNNLKQALFRRLITVPGTLIHRPLYGVGVPLFQGRINSFAVQRELTLRIVENFKRDTRVANVTGVSFDIPENPAMLKIIVRVQAVGYDEAVMDFTPFAEGV
jgi:hypothetical protein